MENGKMAEQKSVRERVELARNEEEFIDSGPFPREHWELINALSDFKRDRASGVIEIHFSQGGVAEVFSKATKTYK
jgi:hypothetical protein